MSMDTVDDLHEAEDMAGLLATRLAELLREINRAGWGGEIAGTMTQAGDAVTQWKGYCRPTCQAFGDPAEAEENCEDPDGCGCPCGHTNVDPTESGRIT